MRFILGKVTIMALGMTMIAACGGPKNQGGGDGGLITVTGEVRQEGGASFAIVLIEAANGRLYMVQSSHIGDELRSLVGMRVSVHGPVIGEIEDVPIIDVRWYELERFPSGERPVVGWIRQGGFIMSEDEVAWKLAGDFEDLLATFVGSKVWVVGVVQERKNTSAGGWRVLHVTDYGVIIP